MAKRASGAGGHVMAAACGGKAAARRSYRSRRDRSRASRARTCACARCWRPCAAGRAGRRPCSPAIAVTRTLRFCSRSSAGTFLCEFSQIRLKRGDSGAFRGRGARQRRMSWSGGGEGAGHAWEQEHAHAMPWDTCSGAAKTQHFKAASWTSTSTSTRGSGVSNIPESGRPVATGTTIIVERWPCSRPRRACPRASRSARAAIRRR